jgi:hypothetical protein
MTGKLPYSVSTACLPRRSGTKAGVLPLQTERGAHASRVPYSASRRIPLMPLRSKPTTLRTASSLLKARKGCSRLLKPFFKNPFFIRSHIRRSRRMTRRIGFIPSKSVLKAESKSRKPMQGKKSIPHLLPRRLVRRSFNRDGSLGEGRPSSGFCQLTPGNASLCQLMPATPPRLSSIFCHAEAAKAGPPPHFICPPLIPIYIFCPNDKG